MRANEFIVESVDPTQQDLKDVADWMNTSVGNLSIKVKQEPIEKFIKQIREMYGTYDEFPEDEERTNRITKLLKRGAQPLPIYVEANDPDLFVMEGRHRMVAFWLAGMTTIPVAYVSLKPGVAEGWLTRQQKPKVDDAFMGAFWAWQQNGTVESVEQAAKFILASPLSKPYQTPPAGIQTIYRTVGDINRSPTARNRVAVAYSPKLSGAEYFFRHQASGNKNFHVVQKKFNPQDFLLDFAAMVKGLGLQNKQYEKEHEIWMRPTQYYASYNANELVDRRGLIQKIRGVQHPTAQAQQAAAEKRAQQDRELDNLF